MKKTRRSLLRIPLALLLLCFVTAAAAEGDATALLGQAKQQLKEGDADAAIASLKRVVELAPDNSDAHHSLGRAYLQKLQSASMFKKLGLSKKVRAEYAKAIELDPDNVEARSSLASYYFNAPGVAGGGDDKGLAELEEIRKRDPVEAHLLLGDHYSGKKQPEKAQAEYRAAIAGDPMDKRGYYALGVNYQREQQWDEAFEAFEAGVSKTGDADSLYQLGKTSALSGQRLEQGKKILVEFIADPPLEDFVYAAHWRLGMIYEQTGDLELARAEYEQSLGEKPDFARARESRDALKKKAAND
jgi:tetratricopeptide (TPR) repeat protein